MGGFLNSLKPQSFMDPNATSASPQQMQQGVQQALPGAGVQAPVPQFSIMDLLQHLSSLPPTQPRVSSTDPGTNVPLAGGARVASTDPGTSTPTVGGARKGNYA